jgi:type IX secretion system PorP/SprF family membrane protein
MILCKRLLYFPSFLCFLIAFNTFGQDAHFSQFYANPLYLNPAFAGTVNCPRVSINFRDQWPAVKGNFLTFSGSYDQHIYDIHGGIGVLFSADIMGGGMMQTYNAGAMYNFRLQVSRQFVMQFALQGSYLSTSLNWNKLEFASDLINSNAVSDLPKNSSGSFSKSQFDASAGIVCYSPFLYFGLAAHHLLPLQMSFLEIESAMKWNLRWTAHAGGKITVRQKVKTEVTVGDIFIHPNFIFSSQLNSHYLHEGVYFNFYPFTIGAWVRHNFKNADALILSCGFEHKIFHIGYSYDFSLSKFERLGGAHEVSLQLIIPCNPDKPNKANKRKNQKYPPMACPKF